MSQNPITKSLRSLAADLAERRITAQELLALSQAAHDPALNAYIHWAPDFARRQAEAADAAFAAGIAAGPLQGIPTSVKDIYGVAGLPVFAGSPRALPISWQREGPVVKKLRKQNEWAFAFVVPQTTLGKPVDFSRTRYAEALREGMFDGGDIFALLENSKGVWTVRDFVVGPTDVAYAGWPEQYGAPYPLFELPVP